MDLIQLHLADFGPDDPRHGGRYGGVDIADPVTVFSGSSTIEDTGFDLHQHVVSVDRVLAGSRKLPFKNGNLVAHLVDKGEDEVHPRP